MLPVLITGPCENSEQPVSRETKTQMDSRESGNDG